jgi:hypothetical protein
MNSVHGFESAGKETLLVIPPSREQRALGIERPKFDDGRIHRKEKHIPRGVAHRFWVDCSAVNLSFSGEMAKQARGVVGPVLPMRDSTR